MRQERLSNLLNISIGRTPSRNEPKYWGAGNKWVSIRDMASKVITETREQITDLAVTEARCKLVPKGTLLFSFKLTIGKMSFAGCDLYTNEAIAAFAIQDDKELSPDFLYYALQSASFRGSNQAVMGKTLNSKSLAEIEIPLPPLDDQVRFANLLNKVEGLIAQRKQHLEDLDRLLKSVFLDMFGDPVQNTKGWDSKPLGDLGSLSRGLSKHRPRNARELLGGKYPLIQTGEVSNAGTYIRTYSQTYSDIGFAQSKLWPAGTLCITIAANIAHTAILKFDACFPDSVVGFTPFDDESTTLFVHGLFWFFRKLLEKNAPAAAQKNINLDILRNLKVPAPPLQLQRRFAAVVERIEGIKTCYQQSLTELESLYGALSQKFLKGELDLSQVPLLSTPLNSAEEVPPISASRSTTRIVLARPAEGVVLSDVVQRQSAIAEWLTGYLMQLGEGETFSTQEFVDAANEQLLAQEDETPEWGMVDYEQLKDWVFEALASGNLSQTFGEDGNRITLQRAIACKAGVRRT